MEKRDPPGLFTVGDVVQVGKDRPRLVLDCWWDQEHGEWFCLLERSRRLRLTRWYPERRVRAAGARRTKRKGVRPTQAKEIKRGKEAPLGSVGLTEGQNYTTTPGIVAAPRNGSQEK